MKQHAMKQNELDLLHRYLDGAITPEELESLEGLLRASAEARAMLRSLATIDAKWQQLATDEAMAMPSDHLGGSSTCWACDSHVADLERDRGFADCWCIWLVPCLRIKRRRKPNSASHG